MSVRECAFLKKSFREKVFGDYWSKLSIAEKESLLAVAKNYVELKSETGSVSLDNTIHRLAMLCRV